MTLILILTTRFINSVNFEKSPSVSIVGSGAVWISTGLARSVCHGSWFDRPCVEHGRVDQFASLKEELPTRNGRVYMIEVCEFGSTKRGPRRSQRIFSSCAAVV